MTKGCNPQKWARHSSAIGFSRVPQDETSDFTKKRILEIDIRPSPRPFSSSGRGED
jgi:hypothetical protein